MSKGTFYQSSFAGVSQCYYSTNLSTYAAGVLLLLQLAGLYLGSNQLKGKLPESWSDISSVSLDRY